MNTGLALRMVASVVLGLIHANRRDRLRSKIRSSAHGNHRPDRNYMSSSHLNVVYFVGMEIVP